MYTKKQLVKTDVFFFFFGMKKKNNPEEGFYLLRIKNDMEIIKEITTARFFIVRINFQFALCT